MAGYGDEDIADAFETFVEPDERLDIIRKSRARQITRIHAFLAHLCELDTVAAPEPDRPPASRELQRKRGPPGARTEDRNRL